MNHAPRRSLRLSAGAVEWQTWASIVVPVGTPRPIVKRAGIQAG